MTTKQLVMLADMIKTMSPENAFTEQQINTLALFCAYNNPKFDRQRWLKYLKTDKIAARTGLDIAKASRLL